MISLGRIQLVPQLHQDKRQAFIHAHVLDGVKLPAVVSGTTTRGLDSRQSSSGDKSDVLQHRTHRPEVRAERNLLKNSDCGGRCHRHETGSALQLRCSCAAAAVALTDMNINANAVVTALDKRLQTVTPPEPTGV